MSFLNEYPLEADKNMSNLIDKMFKMEMIIDDDRNS